MSDFEKLGVFYLGRRYDPTARARTDDLVLYDSRDLATHAVIIGMTGSGKTGLGIDLLEEAAIDGVPAIAIDPKGDMGNLRLTFPRLAPEDFRPWIDEDEAARAGQTPDTFAAAQAESWKKGLAAWGQDGARIERLRETADVAIYTPGSSAGLGISILNSFAAPPRVILDDSELLNERLGTSVSGLLTLVGLDADPVRSREHILISTIISTAWSQGESLDLGTLISRIQNPPVAKIGVLDLESFFPAKDRFELATRLNALLAAPGFSAWLQGEPLDVGRLLYTAQGRPRISVISIAHLGDAERMFFVSLLLNEVVGWMRRQSGTTSLRALLYMDELAGYMPPSANPPSKRALLTLLKQARAFGIGVALSTQNPVDLDYKGLSNAGTWFLGRLQTEQDKARVLDGLEGALSGRSGFDRGEMNRLLSGLPKRVFLLHNVHEDAPELFETRWAMSYLRGPLTRDQIRTLMAEAKTSATPGPGSSSTLSAPDEARPGALPTSSTTARPAASPAAARPVLPPAVPQYFAPGTTQDAPPHYEPFLWATAQAGFEDAKRGVRTTRAVNLLAPFAEGPLGVNWDAATSTDLTLSSLRTEPLAGATFAEVPPLAAQAKSYAAWSKDFARWLFETQTLELLSHAGTGLTSAPDEAEREFRIRVQLASREARDAAKAKLQQKYAPKVAALQDKVRRATSAVEREQGQASDQKIQSVMSIGSSVLGALLGRKILSSTNIGRASTAARGLGRVQKEADDVKRAEANVQACRQQLADLEAELQAELAALDAAGDAGTDPLDRVAIKPRKTQITVAQVALVWVPAAGGSAG
jgi:hypothetical protein